MKLLFNVFKKLKHIVSSCKINSSKLNFHFFSYYVKFCTIWFYFVYLCLILYEKNCRYIIWINGFNVMSGVWSLYFSCKYIVFMYLIFVFHFNFVIINEKLNNFKINNLEKKLGISSNSYQARFHIKSCLRPWMIFNHWCIIHKFHVVRYNRFRLKNHFGLVIVSGGSIISIFRG